jgi:hypothetical protein
MLIVPGSLLAGCTKPVPDDGMAARTMDFDTLNNCRYREIFLVGGTPFTMDLSAAVYDTSDLNTRGTVAPVVPTKCGPM